MSKDVRQPDWNKKVFSLDAERDLRHFLKVARPAWSKPRLDGPNDIDRVLAKLYSVGIRDTESLVYYVQSNTLNELLAKRKLVGFSRDSIECLRKASPFIRTLDGIDTPHIRQTGTFAPVPQLLSRNRLFNPKMMERTTLSPKSTSSTSGQLPKAASSPGLTGMASTHAGGFGGGDKRGAFKPNGSIRQPDGRPISSQNGSLQTTHAAGFYSCEEANYVCKDSFSLPPTRTFHLRGANAKGRIHIAPTSKKKLPPGGARLDDIDEDANWAPPGIGGPKLPGLQAARGTPDTASEQGSEEAGSLTASTWTHTLGSSWPSGPSSAQGLPQMSQTLSSSWPRLRGSMTEAVTTIRSSDPAVTLPPALVAPVPPVAASAKVFVNRLAVLRRCSTEQLPILIPDVSMEEAAKWKNTGAMMGASQRQALWASTKMKEPTVLGEEMLAEQVALDERRVLLEHKDDKHFRQFITGNIACRLKEGYKTQGQESLTIQQKFVNIKKNLDEMKDLRREISGLKSQVEMVSGETVAKNEDALKELAAGFRMGKQAAAITEESKKDDTTEDFVVKLEVCIGTIDEHKLQL